MRRKPPEIRFDEEAATEQRVHQSEGRTAGAAYYAVCARAKPTLVDVRGEKAVLLFPNGARLENVPLRDLVDDSAFWKR